MKRKKGKALLDLKILKKYSIKKQYLFISLISIVVFLLNRRYFAFGVVTIFSAFFSFYHDKLNRMPIDFKMPLFLGIMITKYYGFGFTLIFYILSDIIPTLLAGGQIQGASLLFLGWQLIVIASVVFIPNIDIIVLGIILVFVETIGATLIKSLTGFPGVVALLSSTLSVLVRIIYFLTLGKVVLFVFQNI